MAMDTETDLLNPDSLADVPVFPLPRFVLFPQARVPLHLFEPRYVAMARDLVGVTDPLLAVAQLKPGYEAEYEGRPPTYDVGGVGRVSVVRENTDGTFYMLLEAVARVRIEEHPQGGRPYRTGRLTPLLDQLPSAGVDAGEMAAMRALAQQVVGIVQRAEPGFALPAERMGDPGAEVDVIADHLVLDAGTRQTLLACLDVPDRVRQVSDYLAHLEATLRAQGTSRTLH